MKSPRDVRREPPRRPAGGKALQRLLLHLLERDPALIEDKVRVRVPSSARPSIETARDALRAADARRSSEQRARPTGGSAGATLGSVSARTFAASIVRAAAAVSAAQPRRRYGGRIRRPRGTNHTIVLNSATWTELGPTWIPEGQTYGANRIAAAGRVSALAVDPADDRHLLCASANGGIWESRDAGVTWMPRTDRMPMLAIGAITFDPHNPLRVYAGSGEGNAYDIGAGIYASTDGGATWTVLAGTPFVGSGFFDLVVDPVNRKVLYAGTTTGFYVSKNGGATWRRRHAAPCWDISVHPSGGPVELLIACEDGLFRSTGAATAFAAVTLPAVRVRRWDRLAVDRAPGAPDIVYVFGASPAGRAYLRQRRGRAWSMMSLPPGLRIHQSWYDWYVAVSPTNETEVFLGAIDIHRGTLEGSTWLWRNISSQGVNSIHPDQHGLTFAPTNPRTLYAANDGGVYRSANNGRTWVALNRGLGITEIEYLASDPTTWRWLMAGTQDNGTVRFTGSSTWDQIAQGDGGDCGVNQLDPTEVYHSFYEVALERSNDRGNTWIDLEPPRMDSLFYPPVEICGRTVAIAGRRLVVTRTGAKPWTTVDIEIPRNELASAMRAVDSNTFLVGTNRGRLVRVAWEETTWSVVRLASPAARWMSAIAIDPANPLRIWVTFSQPGDGGVFRSDDAGSTWVNCSRGLPPIPFNAVVVDSADFRRLWVAADVGVYQSNDLGASWTIFSAGLPNAMAIDLLFHRQDRVLFCAMRNRGVWAIHVP